MTKEDFCKEIEYIKSLLKQGDNFSDAFELLLEDTYVTNIFGGVADHLVALLSQLCCDKGEWISYYIWELDFGEKYTEESVTEADGTPIPLKTPEDLWNLLQENCK